MRYTLPSICQTPYFSDNQSEVSHQKNGKKGENIMNKKRCVFHTDLDNTIIYSYKHTMEPYKVWEEKHCVELYQEREISFITRETFRLLQEVKKHILIVPTTTRTIEQYSRIDLGIGNFEYALVCNGGVLLVNGTEDKNWYQSSLELIKYSHEELYKAMTFLEHEKRRNFELRFIMELFLFTKCDEPEHVVEDLCSILDVTLVDVFHNGMKVYVVPKALSKGNAIRRFREYIGAEYVIAAGDSAFDITMLEAADYGIATEELATQYHFLENVISLPSDMYSLADSRLYSEAVLERILHLY